METQQKNFQRREAIKWSDQLVHEITSVSNTISRDVDFWVNNILQGYIIEFAVEAITFYSDAEIKILQEYICYLSVHGSRCSFMRRVYYS